MTQENPSPPPRRLELSSTQVAGSALAAVSAAFFASWLGTAGTLIGAAVGSIVATVGSATYTWWLRRTSEAVRRTAAQVRETGMGSTVVVPRLRNRPPEGPDDAGEEADEQEPGRWAFLRNRPWGKVALVTAGVMLSVLGSITVVEAVAGKPISAILHGDDTKGTSLTHQFSRHNSSGSQEKKQPVKPSPSRSATPNGSSSPTPAPTSTPTATPTATPTPIATPTPVLPTPTATTTPGAAPVPDGTTSGAEAAGTRP